MFLGLHAERLLVFGMFWSLLWVMWKATDTGTLAETELSPENEKEVVSLSVAS